MNKKLDAVYKNIFIPKVAEPLDIDNGITLCKACHIEVYKLLGCTYNELKC